MREIKRKSKNGPLVTLIFRVRQKTGMTLSELARTLGVCHQDMSDISRGLKLNPPKRINGIRKCAHIEKTLKRILDMGRLEEHYVDTSPRPVIKKDSLDFMTEGFLNLVHESNYLGALAILSHIQEMILSRLLSSKDKI